MLMRLFFVAAGIFCSGFALNIDKDTCVSDRAMNCTTSGRALIQTGRIAKNDQGKDHSGDVGFYESAASKEACVPPGMRKVKAGDFQMVVLHNDIVSEAIKTTGFWEISSAQAVVQPAGGVLPKNGTFLDIGANLGYYSFLFARQGFKVVAVEPMTRNRQAIEATLCLNPELRKLVTVVPAALVAPEDATTTSCVIRSTNDKVNIGNGQLHCGNSTQITPCASGDENCEKVPVKTLDAVLTDLKPSAVDVVKMDVEHYECHVLRGGQSLFEKYHPQFMQVETTSPETTGCVNDEAKKFGYRTYIKGDNSLLARNV